MGGNIRVQGFFEEKIGCLVGKKSGKIKGILDPSNIFIPPRGESFIGAKSCNTCIKFKLLYFLI